VLLLGRARWFGAALVAITPYGSPARRTGLVTIGFTVTPTTVPAPRPLWSRRDEEDDVMETTTPADDVLAAVLGRLDAGETLTIDEVGPVFPVERDNFGSGTLGLRWDTLNRDRVTAHLDVDERHHQPYGIVHGGVWCAVIESMASIGAALRVASSGKIVVGVSNSTDFIRAHREGRVEAIGTPVHAGRTQQLWVVELTSAETGKVLSRGQVRLQNIDAAQIGGGA
jgi:1,4-dihydroxy-2-naphthoyl-CoA hydrolase